MRIPRKSALFDFAPSHHMVLRMALAIVATKSLIALVLLSIVPVGAGMLVGVLGWVVGTILFMIVCLRSCSFGSMSNGVKLSMHTFLLSL